MDLTWLANTNQGRMVGDYLSSSFASGKVFPAFAVANAPNGNVFDEALYTVKGGLKPAAGVASGTGDRAVPGARSDHALPAAPTAH